MSNVTDLIARSSVGEGLRLIAYGRALRALRHRTGLSLHKVAAWSGLPNRRVSLIESGVADDVTGAEIERYCGALGVDAKLWVERLGEART